MDRKQTRDTLKEVKIFWNLDFLEACKENPDLFG